MPRSSWTVRTGLSALAVIALASAAQAQGSAQQEVEAIKTAMSANAAAQRNYAWQQTTAVAFKGEVKSTTTSACQYMAGGTKPTCTVTSAPPEAKRQRGPVRRSVKDSKVDELKSYMDSVKTLVAQYVPLKAAAIQAAQGRGDVATAPNPSNGTIALTVSNYLQKGDKVIITVNQTTKQVSHVAVDTWLNDPSATVTLDVAFTTLPNGVSFASTKTLTATAKEVVVTITDAGFALAQ
ncbi:MAG: hypothetical protein R2910_09115 [Gemmatimonadales bacterium]